MLVCYIIGLLSGVMLGIGCTMLYVEKHIVSKHIDEEIQLSTKLDKAVSMLHGDLLKEAKEVRKY